MRTGIYGGAFDPPHIGHIRAAEHAVSLLGLDRLFVVPAWVSPLKKAPSAPAEDRLAMCRLAFGSENTEVCDWELQNGGVSYTKDTIAHFRALYPADELFLIIGTDQLLKLGSWNTPEYIFKNAGIAVVPRYREEISQAEIEKYTRLGARITVLEADVTEISSTEIRNGCADEMLAQNVRDYIESHGLYIYGKNQ